jgi:amidase
VLDFPSGVFPTGQVVDPALDPKDAPREFTNPFDEKAWATYDPEVQAGAPLALQVTARRWEDEKALAALSIISDIVRKARGKL